MCCGISHLSVPIPAEHIAKDDSFDLGATGNSGRVFWIYEE